MGLKKSGKTISVNLEPTESLYLKLYTKHIDTIKMAGTYEDLERRCWELGQKYSHIETINEVYRAEIDRLRDKVNRERGQHARDMEGLKRHYENMAENVKLDHAKEMEKRLQDREAEMEKLKGMMIKLLFL